MHDYTPGDESLSYRCHIRRGWEMCIDSMLDMLGGIGDMVICILGIPLYIISAVLGD
jgi:hypothetical protein